jgi:hypothetical protein
MENDKFYNSRRSVLHNHGSASNDEIRIGPRTQGIEGRHRISKATSTRCTHRLQDPLTKTRIENSGSHTCLPRCVAQESVVQAGRSELGRGRDGSTQSGIQGLKRRKKGQRESSECGRFRSTGPYTGAEGRRKKGRRRKENGWHEIYDLPTSSLSDPSRAPDARHHLHMW